jgi:hypothetical protein
MEQTHMERFTERTGAEREGGREGEIEIEIKRKFFCISLHAQTERNRMEWNGRRD